MDLGIPASMDVSVVEGPGPGLGAARRHNFLRLQDLPGTTSLAWDYKSCVGLQDLPGTTSVCLGPQVKPGTASLAWDYQSCLELQVLPGTRSLAWDYETRLRPQDSRPTARQAPNIEQGAGQKSD